MSDVLLIGAGGWLGRRIRDALGDVRTFAARSVLADGARALAAALEDREVVVVNAAGVRSGRAAEMWAANRDLPRLIAEAVSRAGGHMVHLGSAAEHAVAAGDGVPGSPPPSEYGRSKLAGTLAALETGCATVLRVYNVASSPPQPGSPLEDLVDRIRVGLTEGRVELWSASTVRDWVTPRFVALSAVRAADLQTPGAFDVCSGVGVAMADAVRSAIALLSSDAEVVDLRAAEPTTVVGRPGPWHEVSGLAEEMSASILGGLLRSGVAESGPDARERGV